ncbi:unnamed protein product [Gadus morhua 'NCC']
MPEPREEPLEEDAEPPPPGRRSSWVKEEQNVWRCVQCGLRDPSSTWGHSVEGQRASRPVQIHSYYSYSGGGQRGGEGGVRPRNSGHSEPPTTQHLGPGVKSVWVIRIRLVLVNPVTFLLSSDRESSLWAVVGSQCEVTGI